MVRRHRVTYANVVATVALVVALGGGTALAAVVVHSNADVAPNTIAGHHPPAGDHANLVAGSIAGHDLAANTVSGANVDEKSLDPKVLQRRVIGICIGGSAIQRVLENGAIRCGSPASAFDSENPEPNIALGASPVTVLSTDSTGGSSLALQAPSRVFVHATVDVAHHIDNSSTGLCVLNWSDGSSSGEFGSGGYWGDYLTGSNIFEVDDVEVALTGSVELSSPGIYRLFVRCQVTDGDATTTADNGDLTAIAVPA